MGKIWKNNVGKIFPTSWPRFSKFQFQSLLRIDPGFQVFRVPPLGPGFQKFSRLWVSLQGPVFKISESHYRVPGFKTLGPTTGSRFSRSWVPLQGPPVFKILEFPPQQTVPVFKISEFHFRPGWSQFSRFQSPTSESWFSKFWVPLFRVPVFKILGPTLESRVTGPGFQIRRARTFPGEI